MLGAVLRGRREAAGRSLGDVADAAGISPAHLSEVERGRKDISTERLLGIARTLSLPLADVYAEMARGLGGGTSGPAVTAASPADPEVQLRVAAVALSPTALRAVADFSAYMLAAEGSPRRRIGFRPGGE